MNTQSKQCVIYERLVHQIRSQCQTHCRIIISGLPPRKDVDVRSTNVALQEICRKYNFEFVVQHGYYFHGNSNSINLKLYTRDKVHINSKGTSVFLHRLNTVLPIIKSQRSICFNCGEVKHTTDRCTHGKRLLCHKCLNYGHKKNKCKNL